MRSIDGVEMLDVREAADAVGRTPETIRRWVWSGRLEATKEGNRLLVRRSDITDLATTSGQTESASGAPRPTLADWHARLRAGKDTGTATTAADLVWGDRAGR
jgi:excisionase family DNA binding protein